MRLKLFAAVVLVVSLAFLSNPPDALSQPGRGKGRDGFPGGGFPGGGFPFSGMKGGSMMMMGDPSRLFDMFAKGRDHFLISEMRSLRTSLTEFAQSKGLKDDKITREIFTQYNTYMQSKMGGDAAKGGPGPAPGVATPGTGNTPGMTADSWNQWAEMEFKRRDQNGDNVLNYEEMPGSLRETLPLWDKNRDNLIDLGEYKGHFVARMQERLDRDFERFNPSGNPVAATIIIEEEWDKRPVVYRAGKLPPGLPKWFTELDRDQDGQVSLAEWRRGKKDMDEFANYDRNDDGLMTPAEVLRSETVAKNGSAVNSANEAGRKKKNKGG